MKGTFYLIDGKDVEKIKALFSELDLCLAAITDNNIKVDIKRIPSLEREIDNFLEDKTVIGKFNNCDKDINLLSDKYELVIPKNELASAIKLVSDEEIISYLRNAEINNMAVVISIE